ncbi:MAG: DUF1853 family protein [Marinobacter sp.]|nr:DUF1853 family protein [Marinobacter sp.]
MTISTPSPTTFKTPAIRHLAWMIAAPQLLIDERVFYPVNYATAEAIQRLREWDQTPSSGPEVLSEEPNPRLGYYFERLYECLLTELLGWTVLLKNQQIRQEGRTIGELDFVVYNQHDRRVEHHEIAVKYYLGYPYANGQNRWYGPNARDRLDLKTDHMLHRQSQLTSRPETVRLLNDHDIKGPITTRIFMPGYLFYSGITRLPPPATVPENHLRGRWMYLSELQSDTTRHWVPLNKPHWLGPWLQQEEPVTAHVQRALDTVSAKRIPRLFAEMEPSEQHDHWRETSRIFVVPDTWPAPAAPPPTVMLAD